MLPGLSDTVAVLVLGAQALQVASVVLIFVLALNIALGSFVTLVMMHSREASDRLVLCATMLRGSFLVAAAMVCLGLTSRAFFGPDTGLQSLAFLLLSTARPFFTVWNVYHREILYRNDRFRVVHSLATKAVALYVGISWGALLMGTALELRPDILWLLLGVYASLGYTAYSSATRVPPTDRLGRAELVAIAKVAMTHRIGRAPGLGAALSNSATNVLEIGFLAVAGWVVVARFEDIAALYYPLFNMFEWASAFALGLSRVFTERRIAAEQLPSFAWLTSVFALYTSAFVTLYLALASELFSSFDGLNTALVAFALAYVFFDGLQLILRSAMLADESGGRLLHVSTSAYLLGFGMLLVTWLWAASMFPFLISLLFPLIFSAILLALTSRNSVGNQ